MGQDTLNGSKEPSQFEEELKKFPPSLRKLAKFIANSEDFISISESARQAGLDPKHILNIISIYRRKGKSFNNFIRDTLFEKMASFRPSIMASVIREAQKGSYRHAELYFRLIGDLRPEPRNGPETVNNNLCFVMPMPSSIPMDEIEEPKEHNGAEDHGVIDVDPKSSSMTMIQRGHDE